MSNNSNKSNNYQCKCQAFTWYDLIIIVLIIITVRWFLTVALIHFWSSQSLDRWTSSHDGLYLDFFVWFFFFLWKHRIRTWVLKPFLKKNFQYKCIYYLNRINNLASHYYNAFILLFLNRPLTDQIRSNLDII